MPSSQGSKRREAEPSLYIGDIPRYASGNGLSASVWVAVEDLHASAATALLAVLGDVGIPAYINAVAASGHQAGGHRGHHQLVRLWVEAHQVTRARQLAASVVGRAAVT
jgi:hypothetical protein